MPSERQASTGICCIVILDPLANTEITTAKARSANSSACQMVIRHAEGKNSRVVSLDVLLCKIDVPSQGKGLLG